jgi:hypothetical protein
MKPKGRPRTGRAPYRYKKGGKYIGSYFTRVGVEEINLCTKDPDEAIARGKRAAAGERKFSYDSDVQVAARAVSSTITGTGGAMTSPVVESPAAPAPSLPPPAAAPPPAVLHSVQTSPAALPAMGSSSAPPPAAVPDAIYPPPNGWADAVRAAAGAASDSTSSSSAEAAADEQVDSDVLKEMVEQAAVLVVEAQIQLQNWAIKRGLKIRAAIVDDSAKGREVGKKLWLRCFQRLMPTNLPIPDYLAAPIMVAALTIPIQLGPGAVDISDQEETKETAPGAPATAAAAA